jgi:2-phosphoglycerate kinase
VTALGRLLWIGGGTGGGKSSIAIALAEKHGLERYSYDWHDSRDHCDRTRPDRHPVRAAFLAMSMDERWETRSPEQMVDETIAGFRERFEMVLEDLASLTADRVVADGFGLLPELIAPVIADQRQAIFLLPTFAFREWALGQRGWVTIEGSSDPDRARSNRLARDALLTEHVRRTATARGLTIIEVDGTRSLADITSEVQRRFQLPEL